MFPWFQQSTWRHVTFCFHTGVYAIVLAVRRRIHSNNLFTRDPSTTDLVPCHTFLQTFACIQSFKFVCCCQGLNFTVSKHLELQIVLRNPHNRRMRNTVSLAISRGLLLVPGCPSWLQIKSLTNWILESVLTELYQAAFQHFQ